MKPGRKRAWVLFGVVAAIVALAWTPAKRHLAAATLLARFESTSDEPVEEREITIGSLRARRYAPPGAEGEPVVMLLHGVHSLGIDEPRLVRFARNLAASGMILVTPEISALREMRFDARAIEEIDRAASEIARSEGRRSIGVIGISFGGGLALIAAAQGEHRASIGVVLAIGAHHDARRVARGWLDPSDGSPERYGAGVLAYAYADEYFEGATDARAALRAMLEGEAPRDLDEDARARIDPLRYGADLRPAISRLRAILRAHDGDLSSVSPAGKLGAIEARVFLLHGEDDPLIPSTEASLIARELPERSLGGLARTPLIRHADRDPSAGLGAKIEVVHLMARALGAFEALE